MYCTFAKTCTTVLHKGKTAYMNYGEEVSYLLHIAKESLRCTAERNRATFRKSK